PRGPLHGLKDHRPPVHPEGRRVTSHESPVTPCKSFSFTYFRKNASASPLVSHTFKTKDLKPFRFTHLQKNGGGPFRIHQSPVTNHESLPVSPLDSALTSNRAAKSFTSNTYEKHTQGEGSPWGQNTNHGPRVTVHERSMRVPIPSGR